MDIITNLFNLDKINDKSKIIEEFRRRRRGLFGKRMRMRMKMKRRRKFSGKRRRKISGKRRRKFSGKRRRKFSGKRRRKFSGKRNMTKLRKRISKKKSVKKNKSSGFSILAILGIIFGLIITTFGGIFAWYRYGHKGDLPSWIPTFLTKLLRPSGVVVPTAIPTAIPTAMPTAIPTAIYQQ